MVRFTFIAAAVMAVAASSSAAYAGGYGPEDDVVPLEALPGGVNPLTRGALYNTPPDVIFAGFRTRHHRSRGRILRVRF